MDADRGRLRELLGQVSDGHEVDWDAARRDLPLGEREQADALRDVARIAAFNRLLQRAPGVDTATGDGATLESWGGLLLLERVGSGTAADVFRAWDLELRREVALKLLRTEPSARIPLEKSPLMAEARAAAAIRHPNVVVVHGIAEHDGRVGMWMEFVRGESLEEIVRRSGPLAMEEVRRLGLEIGSAAKALHGAGLLHRDLKPANVVRDADGRWVLTDFGLGARADSTTSSSSSASGTPMYMAPELLRGAPHDDRTEVYALGMLLWFALTGRHPFGVTLLADLLDRIDRGPRPGLAELRDATPSILAELVEKAITPDASMRMPTVEDVVLALERIDLRAVVVPRSSRRPALAVAGVLVLLAVVALWWPRPRTGPLVDVPAAGVAFDIEAALVRHADSGTTFLIDGDRVAPGDRLSLQVRASRPVWVYVLNEDERGERYLLFPQPSFDQANPVPADSTVLLPGSIGGQRSAWTVTSAGGREHFLLVVSPEPVAELQADLDHLPAPQPGRPVRYAEVGAQSVERLRGVGGLTALPGEGTAPSTESPLLFARFRALAGRETGVRGTWVRHIVLENRTP
jgi:eukaryotic-like serine/threonine-protein kinase